MPPDVLITAFRLHSDADICGSVLARLLLPPSLPTTPAARRRPPPHTRRSPPFLVLFLLRLLVLLPPSHFSPATTAADAMARKSAAASRPSPLQQIAHHVANGDRTKALRVIASRATPEEQTNLHIASGDLYARDQPERIGGPRPMGCLYFTGVLPADLCDRLIAGTLSPARFRRELRVKFGVAKIFPRRRADYDECDSNGQRHLWFFRVSTRRRYLIERLMHLDFQSFARRDVRRCSGCRKLHREYWRLSDVGPFLRIRARLLALFAAIGEPAPKILRLRHYNYAF
ncbi:hypothetical protein C8R44DRAFT_891996 [Mycena epipterygia]|nr:hypothetical protein C8R44DRAFT_891996 [Mycena epipterygia]